MILRLGTFLSRYFKYYGNIFLQQSSWKNYTTLLQFKIILTNVRGKISIIYEHQIRIKS